MNCSACGAVLAGGDRFCTSCGRPADEVAATGVVSATPGDPTNRGEDHVPTGAQAAWPASSSSKSRNWLVVGAVGVAALVVGALVTRAALGGDDGRTIASSAPQIPATVESAWRESFDGNASFAGSADEVFAVFAEDDDVEVVAFDGLTGDERWRVDVSGQYGGVGAVRDGVVLVETQGSDDGELVALSASNGDERWTLELDPGEYILPAAGQLMLFVDGEYDGTDDVATQIDVQTGERGERIRAVELRLDFDEGRVVAWDEDEAEVFDIESFDSVLGPVDVDDDATAIGLDRGRVAVAVDDEIFLLDGAGDEVMRTQVSLDQIFSVGGVDGLLVLWGEDEVAVVEPADGRAEERWSEGGYVHDVISGPSGPLVVVADEDELHAYALADGERRFSVESSLESFTTFAGKNAFVVSRAAGTGWEMEAVGYDTGDTLWELDGADGFATVIEDAVLVVEYDADYEGGDVELFR